jgi:hypothetical protein
VILLIAFMTFSPLFYTYLIALNSLSLLYTLTSVSKKFLYSIVLYTKFLYRFYRIRSS